MNKYIDAEKLITEIKGLQCEQGFETGEEEREYQSAIKDILNIITSFQHEQPKVDLLAKLRHHLTTTSREQLEKEWKELEHWNNVGPTVQEFLYRKQPEVDLEEEIDNVIADYSFTKTIDSGGFKTTVLDYAKIARYFYELGLNARKEESKWN